MGHALLQGIVIIFALSIGVLLICHRLRIPSIVGFLVTGVICGPYGLGFIKVTEDVQMLADIGIVMLLFSVGIEFSIKRLLSHLRFFLIGGGLQVAITTLVGFFIAQGLGRPLGESLFLGFLLSLSSTAIVMRVLEKRQETTTPHGRVALGILIFQDIAAVPMMLLTPLLAGSAQEFDPNVIYYVIQGFAIIILVFFAAIKLVPPLMHMIARTRSRELFLLSTLSICFTVAWLTASLGLSLPLGAFLAGLIVSESEYRSEAVEDILPFQDVFTSFFFVTIGMLLNIEFLLANPFLILFITIGVLLFKSSIATITSLATGMPLRTSIIVGITLSQVGEFSFVLARSGISAGIGTDFNYQLFLAVAVMTMAVTPSLIQVAPYIARLSHILPLPERIKSGLAILPEEEVLAIENHVVIVGFGLPGQVLCSCCKEADIPYAIIEIDPVVVRREKQRGEPIFFGDATHDTVLKHSQVDKAVAVAVMTNDPVATLRIVEHVRRVNQDAYLVVRTRWMEEMRTLFELGADEVIPDEFGASVEIFTRILRRFRISPGDIERIVADKRHEGYEMLRLLYKEPSTLFDLKMDFNELGVETFHISKRSIFANKALRECGLRQKYGVNLVMIKRGAETLMQQDENTRILPEDLIVVVGPHESIKKLSEDIA